MNAIKTTLEALDGREEWLPELHTSAAIRGGGVAIWEPDLVLMWRAYDPVEGDHEHTAHILFVCGDPLRMAEEAEKAAARGITHIVWNRGFKEGKQDDQKHEIRKWARLVKRMNSHG